MPPQSDWPKEVKYGSTTVKIYGTKPPAPEGFILKWKEETRWRSTRVSRQPLAAATAKAREVARKAELATKGRHHVSTEDRKILDKLQSLVDLSQGVSSPWDWLHRAELALNHLQQQPISLGEAWERWYLTYQDSPTKTRGNLRHRVGRFVVGREDWQIRDITPPLLEELIDCPRASTFNSIRKEWITLFRWAQKHNYLPQQTEVAPQLIARRKESHPLPSILSLEQGRSIWELIYPTHPHAAAHVLLSGFCGLRSSEAGRVRWGDIDWEASEHGGLEVGVDVVRKTTQSRWVPFITAGIAQAFRALDPGDPAALIYKRKRGQRASKMALEAGILAEWPQNVLRHSFCSYRIEMTGSYGKTADEAGNSESILRKRYKRPVKPGAGEEWFSLPRPLNRQLK